MSYPGSSETTPALVRVPEFNGPEAYSEALDTLINNQALGMVVVRDCIDVSGSTGSERLIRANSILPYSVQQASRTILREWWRRNGYSNTTVMDLDDGFVRSTGFRPERFYGDSHAVFGIVSLRGEQDVYCEPGFNLKDETTGLRSEEAQAQYSAKFRGVLDLLKSTSSDLVYKRTLPQSKTINAGDMALAMGQPSPGIVAVRSRRQTRPFYGVLGYGLKPSAQPNPTYFSQLTK